MENSSVVTPISITQAGPLELEIKWADGHRSLYAAHALRLRCRCANCVDEWSGTQRISVDQIPADVHPLSVESVGRYGLRIAWSDGHSTGIYAFDYLRTLCGCEICKREI
ncbi:MAG: DUF971 domain-containing protein [Candidatus Omnitrophica bacterium]|nr:DUF971 domain-containing protein [Candidatus Omnitrophota bacterium]